MKIFLAALLAGLLGGGAAVGAIALNLVPMPKQTSQVAAKAQPLESEEAAPVGNPELEKKVGDLTRQVEALNARLSVKNDGVSREEYDTLKHELDGLKKSGLTVAKPAGESVAGTGGDAKAGAPVDPGLETAVRDVLEKVQAENAEQRRTERQAQRLEKLEQAKQRIAEFVPKLIEARAEKLNIPEGSVKNISDALVQHAQFRAEILSDVEGQRIDGKEVDRDANKQKLDNLDQTTISALSSYVDQQTAETLVKAVARTGRNNRDNNQRGRRGNRQ